VKVSKLALAIMVVILSACAQPTATALVEDQVRWRCRPLPETFEESDLVGTWRSEYYPGVETDTLILREDGTYRQIYEDTRLDHQFTTPWNRWYVEHRATGGIYLHLEGMHYCLSTGERCRDPRGGGGDWPYYDRCENRSLRDLGQDVILTVEGSEGLRYPGVESVPRGILLWHMRPQIDNPDKFFILQE
jgi:hypothetical protein